MKEKLNILHLEDNENDSELIKFELDECGIEYNYNRVDNEDDFISCLNSSSYSVILSDYSIPSYNGMLALKKAKFIQPETPFIFVSGTLGEDAAVESMKNGATDYVLKNKLSRLVPTLNRALDEVSEKERRQKAEIKFGSLIESARDVIFTLSPEGVFTSINKAFDNITGWERTNWIGKKFDDIIHPDDLEVVYQNLVATLGGRILESCETRLICKDGDYLTGELLSTPLIENEKVTEILGIVRDITERKKSEKQLRDSLKEKELLLKEIHHRVKNNLQIISSLLNMQMSDITDKSQIEKFRETQNRVMSMSYIHQNLYQSTSLSDIDFSAYIKKLVNNLFGIYGADTMLINLIMKTEKIKIGIDTALPCGLIINEIVSNSLKHAFIPGSKGEISISLDEGEDSYNLLIKDNGKGMPENIDLKKSKTLGMMLIKMLVEQIDGKLSLKNKNGTEYKINFPSEKYKNRLKDISM